MYFRVSIVAISILALSGCITAEQQASVAEAPKPLTCHAGADCDAKWSRANAWVTEHAKYKVETKSESLIQTAGPSTFETDPSPTYNIRKIAMGPNEYAIEFAGACDSIFACTPTLSSAQADFSQSIQAVEPATTSPPATKKKKKESHQASSK